MNGYRFLPDAREPYEATQLASCGRCGHTWIHKFMTTASGFANSTTFDACDHCWDHEKQRFRHPSAATARIAEIERKIAELKELAEKVKNPGERPT